MDLLPEYNSTFWKIGRLKTFENWPFQSSDNSCNPERMAAAGFYVVDSKKESDLVECFICSKQLDSWNPDDDPWNEHMKHESQCSFIRLGKSDESTWTVNELFDLFKKYMIKECIHELNGAVTKAKEESTRLVREIPRIYKKVKKGKKVKNLEYILKK